MKLINQPTLKLCITTLVISMVHLISCAQPEKKDRMTTPLPPSKHENAAPGTTDTATFANGCFWCTEAIFEQLDGVVSATSGYTDGHVKTPTYKEVCTGETGHAECLQIVYDPSKISFDELLEVFWETHDPTTLNRQGNDVGTQYRSGIYYHTEEQKEKADKYKAELDKSGAFNKPIVTEVKPFSVFYPAENYHQEYFENNQGSDQYCTIVIRPKVEKFRKVFKDKLKK